MITEERLRELTSDRESFSKTVPGLQVAWDSTSLGDLKECPRKYFLNIIEGYAESGANIHLDFGGALHKVLEMFDKHVAEGDPFELARRKAVRLAMEISGTRSRERNEEGEEIGEVKFFPWSPPEKDKMKSRENFVRTIVWYLEEFREDPAKTEILKDGRAAVEMSFSFNMDIDTPEGAPYILCGHLDRSVDFTGQKFVMDRKTTKSTIGPQWFKKFSPDNQMSLYTLAAQVIRGEKSHGVIVDGIQLAVSFSRFVRGFAYRTPAMLEEWYYDVKYWIKQAEAFALSRYWPMNDTACDKYGGCPFRDICNKDPSVRVRFLESNYIKRRWDPIKVRD